MRVVRIPSARDGAISDGLASNGDAIHRRFRKRLGRAKPPMPYLLGTSVGSVIEREGGTEVVAFCAELTIRPEVQQHRLQRFLAEGRTYRHCGLRRLRGLWPASPGPRGLRQAWRKCLSGDERRNSLARSLEATFKRSTWRHAREDWRLALGSKPSYPDDRPFLAYQYRLA
jgi:hypothetical protein